MPPKKRKNNELDCEDSSKYKKMLEDVGATDEFDSENRKQIVEQRDVTLEGNKINGDVLFCGATNWDLVGRKSVPKGAKNKGGPNLWGPHRVSSLSGIPVCKVISSCTACHCVALTTDGKVYTWGRNDKGQLGHSDTDRKDIPCIVDALSAHHIIDAACGKNHTLFLTNKGMVYGCGDNSMGQLGIGSQTPINTTPLKIHHVGSAIRRMACGSEFSMILDLKGNLYSFGCPEYGQLGHNTDGKFFVTSNKLSYRCELKPRRVEVFSERSREGHITAVKDVYVEEVTCGVNHTAVIDSKKRVFSWGFGGYGRLGHNEPKDEMIPRHLKFFDGPSRGAKLIVAGSSFTMAVNEVGALFLWGQTKTSGEAAMYPKPVVDLSGWAVRSVGCGNKSIVTAVDESVVSWGPSPTYGELAYGDNRAKSSTTPQEAKPLKGTYIHQVSCGYGCTLMIARIDTDDDKKNLDKLPLFTPTA